MIIRSFQSIEKIPEGYLIHGDQGQVKLIFMTDDIIRIRVSFDGLFEEASYALATTAWPDALDDLFVEERTRIEPLAIAYEETGEALLFKTQSLILKLQKDPFAFQLYDLDENLIYQDLDYRAYEKDHLGRNFHYSTIRYEEDHFYGFGEQNGSLDKAGRHMHMNPRDSIGINNRQGGPTYKHIPFYIRVNENQKHALGLFYNNSYDCVFDMGNERSGYWDSFCYYSSEGGDIDLFLLNGPDVKSVVDRYTYLTGREALANKQALGFMYTTMYYGELDENCDRAIYEILDQFEEEGIGVDNFGIPSGYCTGEEDRLRYTFTWNRKRFPEPETFVQTLLDRGINVIPNTKPGILLKHPRMEKFLAEDPFVKEATGEEDYVGRWWGGPGKFVDFTNPAGRKIWSDMLEDALLDYGVHAVWNDNCEYDGVEDREAKCDKEGLGGDMAELKAVQANMMAYTVYHKLEAYYPEERPYILTRCAYAGGQRYAQTWGGDNYSGWTSLKNSTDMILGMGMCGFSNFGVDVGGFAGPAPDEELLLRWIQNGIFYPRFTINSASTDNTVTLPWMYEAIVPEVREAYKLRYRLLPYLYSLMYHAHVSGAPAMRPLFMEYPEDSETYKDKSESFLFGPSLLVANVLEKGLKKRRLYLPEGSVWYDPADDFRAYTGGQYIEIPVDRSSIPMFFRGDGLLVYTDDIKHIKQDPIRELKVLIGTDGPTAFDYFDDDGYSTAYKDGHYALTHIKVETGEVVTVTLAKEGSFEESYERLEFNLIHKKKGAYWVQVGDKVLPQCVTRKEYDLAEEGWFYDMNSRICKVKFIRPEETDYKVRVSFEKFDLIGMENES